MYGYATGIAVAIGMLAILNTIRLYGSAEAWHSTGDFLLWVEIIAVCGLIPFCIYKFFKNVVDREKKK